jgi:hypothetical protein
VSRLDGQVAARFDLRDILVNNVFAPYAMARDIAYGRDGAR